MTRSLSPGPASAAWTTGLLIAQFVLIWTTFFILSSAIGWPASLGDPAAVALPRLTENAGAVMAGYGFYMLAALLLVPATATLNARLGISPALAQLTLALAVLSAVFKAIGIGRWLFVMPSLAEAWRVPGADHATLSIVFDALNAYAGGVGEGLGVGLISGLWTVIVGGLIATRRGPHARWGSRLVGGYAVITGLGLFLTVPGALGVEMGPVLTLTNIAWQFALLFIALWAAAALRRSVVRGAGQ